VDKRKTPVGNFSTGKGAEVRVYRKVLLTLSPKCEVNKKAT